MWPSVKNLAPAVAIKTAIFHSYLGLSRQLGDPKINHNDFTFFVLEVLVFVVPHPTVCF
jgi:hypothetical protein